MTPIAADQGPSRGHARSLLIVLFGINLLNYIDRLVISGLLEPIGRDLRLTDAQLGQIALGFLATYSILPPLLGWIADRAKRTSLVAGAIMLWSASTGCAGLTRGLGQLIATRAAAGAGEATFMTVAPSMIADIYPAGRRGAAMSFFYTASPVGAALGVMLGGAIAAAYGWRTACLLVGFPGIVMAIPMLLFREPTRGGLDPGEPAERPALRAAIRSLVRNRAYLLLVLAYTAQIFAYNAVEFWLPTILQRDKTISLLRANTIYGVVVFVAGFIGPLMGGFLGDRLSRRTSLAYYWVCAASAGLSVVPILVFAALERGTPLFGAVFVEILLGNMSTGLVFALLMTVVVPGLRSTATAIMLTTIHVFGDAVSQPLVGFVSTTLQQGHLPRVVYRTLAIIGVAPEHTLSMALVVVVVPAAALSACLYLVAMPRLGGRGQVRGEAAFAR